MREPSLGSIRGDEWIDQGRWAAAGRADLEDEHDGAEPDDDGEPSLGSFDRVVNQEHSWTTKSAGWFVGNDLEQDEVAA
jgi:hypothetical protein